MTTVGRTNSFDPKSQSFISNRERKRDAILIILAILVSFSISAATLALFFTHNISTVNSWLTQRADFPIWKGITFITIPIVGVGAISALAIYKWR